MTQHSHNASYEVYTTAEAESWQKILPADTSVFGSLEYARISQRETGHKPHLFVYGDDVASIAYPFFSRPVNELEFAASAPSMCCDTYSPEYTGPMHICGKGHALDEFPTAFSHYCQRTGIVAEFIHLHPWHAFPKALEPDGVHFDREIVYVDLLSSLNSLWSGSFTYACQKNIKKSQREAVRVYEATSESDIGQFHRIYRMTMDRNKAHAKYYFSLNYFLAFFHEMPDHAIFLLAEYEGKAIAGTLYLHDNTDVYSYLGGADNEFQSVRPTNLIVYEIIRWAKSRGKERLVLGGGYQRDDGIFRFKASFSPLRARFHVYRKIHQATAYQLLCQAWSEKTQVPVSEATYFPAYRTPIST